ncbi:MAG TPA: hypothetical protein VMT76_00785 [Puia sp.]|nr:hypothetical protein [Puia sp.]
MIGAINVINPEEFVKAFQDISSGKAQIGQISTKAFEIKHYDTQPVNGHELPKDFPNCCAFHTELFQMGTARYEKLPNCCEPHKRLNQAKWFKKENYAYFPMKLVTTLAYSWHCVKASIDKPEWYKEITDYLDYSMRSYGQLPDGFGPPVGIELYVANLAGYIEQDKHISFDKKQKLLEFLTNFDKRKPDLEQTDINLLLDKYHEWFKIFPFEISFLRHLKPYFEKHIPILKGKGDTNMYSGLTAFQVTTKKELVQFLNSVTLTIIKTINTRFLFESKMMKDVDALKIEMMLANRRVEIQALDRTDWKDRREYIKMLKQWLKGEKKFLNEIWPILQVMEKNIDFVKDLIDGIWRLQKNDINEACIVNVREDKAEKEATFRNWFKNFFQARYPEAIVSAEEEKGKRYIDLKITHPGMHEKIVEFKGWWNYDKKNIASQICSHLTDFENAGYVFMINHKQDEIISSYKELVEDASMNYVEGSWKEIQFQGTDMFYYVSKHKFSAKEKTVYHFIFNVWFSHQQ